MADKPTDGRYEGGDDQVFVDLRLDVQGAGVVSADVYQNQDDYVASMRTAPGITVAVDDGPWPVVWQDSLGDTCTGSLALEATNGADADTLALTATLRLDKRLNGLPPRRDLTLSLRRVGDELRRLGVEVETEDSVELPGTVDVGGSPHNFEECLTQAGFAVHMVGEQTTIPAQPGGWNGSVIFTVLNDLMESSAQAPLAAPVWELHLLMLSKTTRRGLFGIMFDSGEGQLQRQGAAVFVDDIRSLVPPDRVDRKILQTTVHELGHALNLAHRFERVVGRADSTSFMNYDWRYLGGGRSDDYWNAFAFSFDPDELEFLRHSPRSAAIPGGAAFHSINYWAEGAGGYSPYVPEVPAPGFRLTLTPPATGPIFAFGQPVFLEVRLQNRTADPITLPAGILDPKAGFLEILVRKRTGQVPSGLVDAVPFVPILQRCFDVAAAGMETLPSGNTLRNNLNLTFGSGGFAFAEPGEYEIIPLLGLYRQVAGIDPEGEPLTVELVIRGEPLRIRVAHPQSLSEERDALTLFRPDVGAWFALGGSDCLEQARDDLVEVRERRTAETGAADPVVAAIVRAEGIHAGRPSIRFADGRFTQVAANDDRAAELLGSLDDQALAHFDGHTAEHTRRLAETYAR
jgi:hypothetical protein